MPITKEQAHMAARMIKVLKLTSMPGMDATAIMLNSDLTYDEAKVAECWGHAMDVAAEATAEDRKQIMKQTRKLADRISL